MIVETFNIDIQGIDVEIHHIGPSNLTPREVELVTEDIANAINNKLKKEGMFISGRHPDEEIHWKINT